MAHPNSMRKDGLPSFHSLDSSAKDMQQLSTLSSDILTEPSMHAAPPPPPPAQSQGMDLQGVCAPTSTGPPRGRRGRAKKVSKDLCQICGDYAAGFHCGAFVCEPCKKFYLRSLKLGIHEKFACTKSGLCEITKDRRSSCQKCRFEKCVSLGMYIPGDERATDLKVNFKEIACGVCGGPSSGYHFGAITCESCKGFFRRVAREVEQDKQQLAPCNNQSMCVITETTRSTCKNCRYHKCLQIGMTFKAIRMGRQPYAVKRATLMALKSNQKLPPSVPDIDIKMEPMSPRALAEEIMNPDMLATASQHPNISPTSQPSQHRHFSSTDPPYNSSSLVPTSHTHIPKNHHLSPQFPQPLHPSPERHIASDSARNVEHLNRSSLANHKPDGEFMPPVSQYSQHERQAQQLPPNNSQFHLPDSSYMSRVMAAPKHPDKLQQYGMHGPLTTNIKTEIITEVDRSTGQMQDNVKNQSTDQYYESLDPSSPAFVDMLGSQHDLYESLNDDAKRKFINVLSKEAKRHLEEIKNSPRNSECSTASDSTRDEASDRSYRRSSVSEPNLISSPYSMSSPPVIPPSTKSQLSIATSQGFVKHVSSTAQSPTSSYPEYSQVYPGKKPVASGSHQTSYLQQPLLSPKTSFRNILHMAGRAAAPSHTETNKHRDMKRRHPSSEISDSPHTSTASDECLSPPGDKVPRIRYDYDGNVQVRVLEQGNADVMHSMQKVEPNPNNHVEDMESYRRQLLQAGMTLTPNSQLPPDNRQQLQPLHPTHTQVGFNAPENTQSTMHPAVPEMSFQRRMSHNDSSEFSQNPLPLPQDSMSSSSLVRVPDMDLDGKPPSAMPPGDMPMDGLPPGMSPDDMPPGMEGVPPEIVKMLMQMMANMPNVTTDLGPNGETWNSMCANFPENLPRNWVEFSESCGIPDFSLTENVEHPNEFVKSLIDENSQGEVDLKRVQSVSDRRKTLNMGEVELPSNNMEDVINDQALFEISDEEYESVTRLLTSIYEKYLYQFDSVKPWPSSPDFARANDQKETWKICNEQLMYHCKVYAKYINKIPGFTKLPVHDQTLLLRESIYPVTHLYYSKKHDLKRRQYNFFNSSMEEKVAILRDIPPFHVLGTHFHIIGSIVEQEQLTKEEIAIISCMLVFIPDPTLGLKALKDVIRKRVHLTAVLFRVCKGDTPEGAQRFQSLMQLFPVFHWMNLDHLRACMDLYKDHQLGHGQLWAEIFFYLNEQDNENSRNTQV